MSYTPEEQEKIDTVKDFLRGGPRKRLTKLVNENRELGSLDEFVEKIKRYIQTGHKIDSFTEDIGGDDYPLKRFWADFELVTSITVPASLRANNPIECCA